MIFYYFCVFMKTVGFCTVFIADMNSACKNTLVSVYLSNFHKGIISANFMKSYSLAIQPIFSKIWKFLICFICLLFHLKLIFDDFLWQSAQEFQWKSQTINKNEWFSIIFAFLSNRRILHCFHCRYEFCLQKYPSKCIFIEFP